MPSLSGKSFLVFVGEDYEDLELWYPKLRLEEAGAKVVLAGIEAKRHYPGKHGYPCPVDGHVKDFPAASLVGILAPGGWAPDKLRRDPDVLERIRELHRAKRMVATICHGPWILISAGITRGRKLTSTVGIKDDVVNSGAEWVDQPVVIDRSGPGPIESAPSSLNTSPGGPSPGTTTVQPPPVSGAPK